jgi:hypothetical protein
MGLLERADNKARAGGASPIERRQRPARDEHGRKARDRVVPRRSALAALIFDVPGGSFAFVMATGIVSIAAMRLGHGKVGALLFGLNWLRSRSSGS